MRSLWFRSSTPPAVDDSNGAGLPRPGEPSGPARSQAGHPPGHSPPWDARRIFLANLVVLGVAACFALLYRFAAPLFVLFVGMTVGMAVRPGVEWLRRHGVSRWAGALAIYLALGALFAAVLVRAVPIVAEEAGALVSRVPQHVAKLRQELRTSNSHTLRQIGAYLPPSLLRAVGDPAATLDVATLMSYAGAIGRNVFTVAAVLLLGFYWTLEGDRRVRALILLAPFERRRSVRGFLSEVERSVGSYVRGQSLVCLIIGVLAFGIYRLIGVPHAPVLGLVYALGETVPVIGPIVCTIIVSIVALSISPSLVLAVIAAAAFLQLVENYLLIPRVMEKTVGVNPLVTLLAITAFGSVLGIAGAILAIPLAAIVQLLLYRFLLGPEAQRNAPPPGRDRSSVIRYEVRELTLDIRKLLRGKDRRPAPPERAERLEDALEEIGHDLERILARAPSPEARTERSR